MHVSYLGAFPFNSYLVQSKSLLPYTVASRSFTYLVWQACLTMKRSAPLAFMGQIPLTHLTISRFCMTTDDSLLGRKADVSGSALSQFWIGCFVAVTEWGGGNNKNWRWVARFYRCRFRSRSQKHRRYFQADGLSAGQR